MTMKEKKQQDKSPKNKKKEHLSERDIKELMGVNQPTYKRNRHGAVSNKRY
jgi:hypothetical protein